MPFIKGLSTSNNQTIWKFIKNRLCSIILPTTYFNTLKLSSQLLLSPTRPHHLKNGEDHFFVISRILESFINMIPYISKMFPPQKYRKITRHRCSSHIEQILVNMELLYYLPLLTILPIIH